MKMNEQEQSEAVIETQKPEEKTGEPGNKPKSRRGAVGKIACPICSVKWHPKRDGATSNFVEAHRRTHGEANLQYRDFVIKESSSS
jgi:hypothetical protein